MPELAVTPDNRLTEVLDLFVRNNVALNTQQTYGRALQLYFDWLGSSDPFHISFDQAIDYRTYLMAKFSPATSASYLSAVKAFYKLLQGLGHTSLNVWPLVKTPKAPTGSSTRALTDDEMDEVTGTMGEWSHRDKTMLNLLYEAALRRDEVASLPVAALIQGRDGYALQITGKGQKTRLVGITSRLARDIEAIIETDPTREFVFPGRTKGHITPRAINKIMDKAGIHPHQLRHTHITEAHEGGCRLADISMTVGHSDPRTTMRYLDKRNAVSNSTGRIIGRRKVQGAE